MENNNCPHRYIHELETCEVCELQQRNAELAAQVESMRKAVFYPNAGSPIEWVRDIQDAAKKLPTQCLAEHDREVAARAGRDGYMQCAKDFGLDAKGTYVNGWAAYQLADKYANEIRRG